MAAIVRAPIDPGQSFELQLSQFEADTVAKLDTVMRKVSLDLFSAIVAGIPVGIGTPVDTGRARGGWQVGIDVDPMNDTGRLDKTGEATIAAATTELANATAENTIYISNNVIYIVPLEEGHSLQAPAGMVRTAIAAFPYFIERTAAEVEAT